MSVSIDYQIHLPVGMHRRTKVKEEAPKTVGDVGRWGKVIQVELC